MRCLKRHVANEVYAALLNPATDNPAGREPRSPPTSDRHPDQRPRRHSRRPLPAATTTEIGTRADPDLEARSDRRPGTNQPTSGRLTAIGASTQRDATGSSTIGGVSGAWTRRQSRRGVYPTG